ncbi:MAG: holo-ACP synthase [Idiomarina sp.]|nr:holo-ACP synthase [Idiomarina sp.]
MSIVGIGTDIVSIRRIEQVLARNPDFALRVLTPAELERYANHPKPAAFLAKRWAAKEAAAKALGTGIGKVSFQHILISNHDSGQPRLEFFAAAQEQASCLGACHFHLSISDEQDYAIAYVVLSAN